MTKWLVAPGDQVHRGDIVVEVETEKATIEAEIFENGVIDAILVKEGERVPVGTVLARVVTAGAPPHEAPLAPPPTRTARPRKAAPPAPLMPVVASTPEGLVLSPLVRHLAEGKGVELKTLRGSGPGGEITRADVEGAARATREATGMRRASPMARRRARELGVALDTIVGSGPDGAIVASDVERAASARTSGTPGEGEAKRERHEQKVSKVAPPRPA